MALLIDDGQGGQISADLLAAMDRVQGDMGVSPDEDAVFDLSRSRRNIALRADLAARDLKLPPVETAERVFTTPKGDVTVRAYAPNSTGPVIVFIHGGGWMAGSVDTHDAMARWFAVETGGMILAPAYSLAPEHPFPHAIVEVAAIISAVQQQIEPGRRLFIMGDSAGANIAAMAILRLTPAERAAIAGFVSIYGAYAPDMGLSSHRLYGDGRFGLSEARMRWCWTLYAPQLFPDNLAEMTPLGKDLSSFPPTLCIGAECDVLLDDSMSLYSQLAAATVDVSLSLWPGLPHGCLHYVGVVDSVTNAARSITRYIALRRPVPKAVAAHSVEVGEASSTREELVDVSHLFAAPKSRVHGSIAHVIAMDIMRGVLTPGQSLPTEESASAAMNISRSAYREAMRTLSAKGLVVSLPKVGTKIAPHSRWNILDPDLLAWNFEAEPDEQFIHDLFELRKTVAPNAAALAAARRNDADIEALSEALARIAANDPGSLDGLTAAVDFHRTILLASKNQALAALWPAVNATLRWSTKLQMMLATRRHVHDSLADHTRVFDSVRTQSEGAARTAMAELVSASCKDTMSNLERVRNASR